MTADRPKPSPVRAVCLLSGGLDSQLAICVLREQGVEVCAMAFRSPFFGPGNALAAGKALGVPVQVEDFSKTILGLLRDPPHGFGSGMNPCIDCHMAMVRHAGQWMEANGYHLIATGEVLNQRPMSQNRQSLAVVAKGSGYADRLLRPLSARLLPETEPERLGWVDRARLGDLQGRSRKPQMDLARRYGIRDYPQPAGGCALTDPTFSLRLRELLAHEGVDEREIQLLRLGRRFRVNGRRLILGRNRADNASLEKALGPGDILLRMDTHAGPLGLAPAATPPDTLAVMAGLCARYSDCPPNQPVRVRLTGPAGESVLEVMPADPEVVERFRI
jgi:hypothetical protein